MGPGRRACEAVHLTALAVWLGSLVMTGVAVAIVFATSRELDPQLPAYAGYEGEHWRLAGGQIAARVFLATDIIQFGAVLAAGISFAVATLFFGLPMRRLSTFLRAALLLGLICVLSYQFFLLAPEMNANLRQYWSAALAGDTAAAEGFRAAFDQDHPVATRLLVANTIQVLALLVVGVWTLGERDQEPGAGASGLEEPLLARMGR